MKRTYYIYTHTRNDNNEVFYVGMAMIRLNKNTHRKKYARAYRKVTDRTQAWFDVTSETDYTVNIVYHTTDKMDAHNKEAEFIKLYGRKMDGGTLINVKIGDYDHSLYSKPVLQLNKNTGDILQEYYSIREASRKVSADRKSISHCCHKKRKSAAGYKWKFK